MANSPLPFAHPFVTTTPFKDRQTFNVLGHAVTRMRDAVRPMLEPVPHLTEDPVWKLADVIGSQRAHQIEQSGAFSFHAVGDTGAGKSPVQFHDLVPEVEESQIAVARTMNADIHADDPGHSPAFFFHLGDVVYFNNTPTGYHEQFYVPYQSYTGKIIAIPGNHDGEVFLGHQRTTLVEFMKNFCQAEAGVPDDAAPVLREMSAQPGVYWWLQAPFADVIGLYSNAGEGQGAIRGRIPGEEQFHWFQSVLSRIAAARHNGPRRALIVATHHPPITAGLFNPHSTGHTSSEEMRGDMDRAFDAAGLVPDLCLSAHAHNYQRFTRRRNNHKITYIVAGGGGRKAQSVIDGRGQVSGEFTYERSHSGHGYLLVTADAHAVTVEYKPVPGPDAQNHDTVRIPFA